MKFCQLEILINFLRENTSIKFLFNTIMWIIKIYSQRNKNPSLYYGNDFENGEIDYAFKIKHEHKQKCTVKMMKNYALAIYEGIDKKGKVKRSFRSY